MTDILRPKYPGKMRPKIRKLQPEIYRSKNGAGKTYASLDLGKLSAIEGGGYKLDEGAPTFVLADNKKGILEVVGQLIGRLDQALFEARLEAEVPPGGF